MTHLSPALSHRYRVALQRYLKQADHTRLGAALRLGSLLQTRGTDMRDLARIHEHTVIEKALLGCPAKRRDKVIRLAGSFYAAVITPHEKAKHGRAEVFINRGRLIAQLSRRTVELAASNVEWRMEITRRNTVELELRKKELRCQRLLVEATEMREHSRQQSRRIISAQEDERKRISHELHDVIAQTLMAINVHLATLKMEAELNTAGLGSNITRTQELVINSVGVVHQFARTLRPTVLDDLGLVPALKAFMKEMGATHGLRMRLRADAGVEHLDIKCRTVLFRVAQEALTNVLRHAHASEAVVRITLKPGIARMTIHDNGKSIKAQRALLRHNPQHLGVIGMRERVEMIDGTFQVTSAHRSGTTIMAEIPLAKHTDGPARSDKGAG
jgi:signal transduction histidine kinase